MTEINFPDGLFDKRESNKIKIAQKHRHMMHGTQVRVYSCIIHKLLCLLGESQAENASLVKENATLKRQIDKLGRGPIAAHRKSNG